MFGLTTADLLDDDGLLNPAKVDADVEDLLAKRPRLAKDYEADAEGMDGGASPDRQPWRRVVGQPRQRT